MMHSHRYFSGEWTAWKTSTEVGMTTSRASVMYLVTIGWVYSFYNSFIYHHNVLVSEPCIDIMIVQKGNKLHSCNHL